MTRSKSPKFIIISIVFAGLIISMSLKYSDKQTNSSSPLSPTALCFDESGNMLVALRTGNRIEYWNPKENVRLRYYDTEVSPTGIICSKDNVYITSSYSEGYIIQLRLPDLKPVKKTKLGFGARSPVLHPSGEILYVANQFSNDISVVDVMSLKEIKRIPVLRQPFAQDIDPTGQYLFVANFLPEGRADKDTVTSSVSVISTSENIKIKDIPLANGSNALRDLKTSPDGYYVFVSHNLGRFQVPTSQLEQGWMNTSALSIIDAKKLKLVATILLDEVERGAAGSWGIECTEDLIIVAHSGTHDISFIDYKKLKNKLLLIENKAALAYDLTFLSGIRTRVPVNGNGPRELAIYDGKLFAGNYFTDNISVFDLKNFSTQQDQIELNPGLVNDSIRIGEILFHDASYCFQEWQACTGCHPNDARVDGLNWDLLNDGLGNPKNCKSMLLAHSTPPVMITGIRADAESAVRAGFRHIQFISIEEDKARAVDLYLSSLKPVPSPFLVKGKLSKNAKKGQKVFLNQGCEECHAPPLFTNQMMSSIGPPDPYNGNNTWDTPTLIEVWRTGPYLYDGRCSTLDEVFDKDLHGLISKLAPEDLKNLVEYVNSL